jgi:hypothetical protein
MVGNILTWIKANLLIVISIALIVILLPVGWFFSSGWNSSIQEKAAKAYSDEKRKLTQASSVDYSLPRVLKDEEPLSESRAPNAIVTRFYKERKEQREAQVNEVIERGTLFNQANHSVPVADLLPSAGSESELRRKGYKLGQLIAGTPEAPSLYARLLRKLNAGDAPEPETLASSLSQYKKQQEESYAATSTDGRVSTADADRLKQDLIKRRLGEYAGRAESIAFYCPLTAIQTEKPEKGYSHVPATEPGYDSIKEGPVYTWVWDYWIISDLLRAVSAANTDPSGVSLAVPDAPVKHVERIRVNEFIVADAVIEVNIDDFGGRGGRGGRGGSSSNPASDDKDQFKAYTNRHQQPNNAFDVRYAEMTVIASSQQLPALFDALGKTNYMTVVDADIEQVDVQDALLNGYYYGDDHVVRARIKIETVWLRSWTTEFMPEKVKQTLGIATGSNEDLSDG